MSRIWIGVLLAVSFLTIVPETQGCGLIRGIVRLRQNRVAIRAERREARGGFLFFRGCN